MTRTATATPTITLTPTVTATSTPTIYCRTGGVFGSAVTNSDNNSGTGYTYVSGFCLGESGSVTALSIHTSAAGWNTIGVGSHAVTAGTYWLGFYAIAGNSAHTIGASNGTGRRRIGNGDFPAAWSANASWNDLHHCMEGFYSIP